MIMLLLYLTWSMAEAPADNGYMRDIERPNIDIVRRLNYVHRTSDNQSGTTPNVNADARLVNTNNNMSAERINELHKYIASKTKGVCDFTCHKCYRCSLVHGKLESNNTEDLFLYE